MSSGPDPTTLGARIQRQRVRRGLSVRELADRAGVNKNTIVRMEKGLTPSYATLNRVCEALGVHIAQLTRPEVLGDELVSIHSRADEGPAPLASDEGIVLRSLGCRLSGGRLNSALMELFGESEPTTHPGEEHVFCLRGNARLTVAGRDYTLSEGDAAVFWSTERHSYAPAPDTPEDTLPVLLLLVWIDARDENSGREGP
ncbi:MAG: helix-turn-helix domain-containing protein [Armatimonadota bacterium]